MKTNALGFSFYLRIDKQNAKGESLIFAKIRLNSQKAEISTKRYIHPRYWDKKKYIAKKPFQFCKELNEHLQVVKNKLYAAYTQLLQSNKSISVQNIKDLYLGKGKIDVVTMVQLSTLHINEMEQFLGKSSFRGNYKNYKTTHKYILEFIPLAFKKKDLPLEEINYSFIKQYEYFLQTEKDCTQNGIMKQMQRLRKVFNWGIRNEYLTENPLRSYKISFKKYDRGYLKMEEIAKLENLSGLSKKLQYTQDFFIFQLYTGLAYSDVIDLKVKDIVSGIDNTPWIIKNRVKTNVKITIPLLPKSIYIISKYSDLSMPDKNIFPRISNQKINQNLKELGEIAGVLTRLSTHLARHSAATTIWLSNGVSIEVVSKMLGHTKISTTQIYGRIVEEKIAEEMKELKQKLRGE
ncbi:MAG: integrase [Bacteroidota bacterium]|nr:integrase [Bacteroidota bacterium]